MAPKIVDKEAKKIEILHAAMQVFSQKGMVNTRMVDIAQTAGIGKGTIYEYFKNKEEIFAGAFQSMMKMVEAGMGNIISSDLGPVEKLKGIIDISIKEFIEHGGEFVNIMLDFWAESIRTKDKKTEELIDLKGMYREYRAVIADILDEGVQQGIFKKIDVKAVSCLLIAALDGVMLQWIMEPGIIDLRTFSETTMESILNGIVKR